MSDSANVEVEAEQGFSEEIALKVFWIVVAVVSALKFLVGIVLVPAAIAPILDVISPFLFVGLSIFGLIRGASRAWSAKEGAIFLVLGGVVHLATFFVMRLLQVEGIAGVVLRVVQDAGIMIWTLGLGALVGLLIKEKNLLLPVAIFLAGFDMFLILTPNTPQAQIVRNNPEVVGQIGSSVPRMRADTEANVQAGARIESIGYVGPADYFVTAALFAVIYRHRMKARKSATWLIPVLGGYMILALAAPIGGLPALVPIGATVLLVNIREFRLSKEEKQATFGVAVVALLLAGYGLYQAMTYRPPIEPVEPLPSENV